MAQAVLAAHDALPDLHGISQLAFDLIVAAEISDRATYEKKYRHPTRPGGQSGITIGIGYDCGYVDAAALRKDWSGRIAQPMIQTLCGVAGLKGQAAQQRLASVRLLVDVSWDAALAVFRQTSLPAYLARTRSALPGFDALPASCKGALVSLVYNRGASFTMAGPRYQEMRNIRTLMTARNFAAVPAEFRKMKRLWTAPAVRGVALRREREARLFEAGLVAGEKARDQAVA